MVLLEEVVASAAEYDRLYENVKALQHEWKEVRQTFKNKIQPLKDRMEGLEKIILDYLDANNLPGVKMEGTMFMREEIVSYKTREAKIEDVLKTEPPASKPETVTRKIIDILKKRVAENPEIEKKHFRLKIFRQ